MAIETDKFGLTDDQKIRLTSVGLTKEEIKMVNNSRIAKEIADARSQLDKLEAKIGGGPQQQQPSEGQNIATSAGSSDVKEPDDPSENLTKSLMGDAQRLCPSCPKAVQHVMAAVLAKGRDTDECYPFLQTVEDYFANHKDEAASLTAWDTDEFIVPGSDEDLNRLDMIDKLLDEGKDKEAEALDAKVGIGPEVIDKIRSITGGDIPFLSK